MECGRCAREGVRGHALLPPSSWGELMIIVTNKPCSFLTGLFKIFFNVSRVIEIKYFTGSTKLDRMFWWSQDPHGRESSLVYGHFSAESIALKL